MVTSHRAASVVTSHNTASTVTSRNSSHGDVTQCSFHDDVTLRSFHDDVTQRSYHGDVTKRDSWFGTCILSSYPCVTCIWDKAVLNWRRISFRTANHTIQVKLNAVTSVVMCCCPRKYLDGSRTVFKFTSEWISKKIRVCFETPLKHKRSELKAPQFVSFVENV